MFFMCTPIYAIGCVFSEKNTISVRTIRPQINGSIVLVTTPATNHTAQNLAYENTHPLTAQYSACFGTEQLARFKKQLPPTGKFYNRTGPCKHERTVGH